MILRLVAWTKFDRQAFLEETGFLAEGEHGPDLCEAAGRLCYLSWNRPNPKTANNLGYLANILDHEHFSVLEHGTATILFQGVSRNFTHELIRHRHFSVSEVSQRYVDPDELGMTEHPGLAGSSQLHRIDMFAQIARSLNFDLAEALMNSDVRLKQAREAARSVLPGMTETKILVTGNYRAWRHMINMRGSEHADAEIRQAALAVSEILFSHVPAAFQDLHYYVSDDGENCVCTKQRDRG